MPVTVRASPETLSSAYVTVADVNPSYVLPALVMVTARVLAVMVAVLVVDELGE